MAYPEKGADAFQHSCWKAFSLIEPKQKKGKGDWAKIERG